MPKGRKKVYDEAVTIRLPVGQNRILYGLMGMDYGERDMENKDTRTVFTEFVMRQIRKELKEVE